MVYGLLQNEILMYLLSKGSLFVYVLLWKFEYSHISLNQAKSRFNQDFNIFTVVIIVLAIFGKLFLPF